MGSSRTHTITSMINKPLHQRLKSLLEHFLTVMDNDRWRWTVREDGVQYFRHLRKFTFLVV